MLVAGRNDVGHDVHVKRHWCRHCGEGGSRDVWAYMRRSHCKRTLAIPKHFIQHCADFQIITNERKAKKKNRKWTKRSEKPHNCSLSELGIWFIWCVLKIKTNIYFAFLLWAQEWKRKILMSGTYISRDWKKKRNASNQRAKNTIQLRSLFASMRYRSVAIRAHMCLWPNKFYLFSFSSLLYDDLNHLIILFCAYILLWQTRIWRSHSPFGYFDSRCRRKNVWWRKNNVRNPTEPNYTEISNKWIWSMLNGRTS